MAYSKTTWTDGTTPVDASNLNKIEDALVDQDERIDANSTLITGLDILGTMGESIPSGADLNDYITPGKYYIANSTTAQSIENAPYSSSSSTLFTVLATNSAGSLNRVFQIILVPSNARIYVRSYYNNWTSWYLNNMTVSE